MRRLIELLLRLEAGEFEGVHKLVPTFASEYNNWIILGLSVLFLAMVALTVFSYLREGPTPRRVKLTLAGIRIAIIFCLFALLFQPALILRYKKDMYSTVAVVFDDSLSMSLKDRYADAKLRQAVAAKLSVDVDQLKDISRSELIRRVLARREGPLGRLARDHRLVLLRFSTSEPGKEAYTQRLAELPVAAKKRQREEAPEQISQLLAAKLTAGGYETNLAATLRDTADRLQGRRVAAIVVISDGQITGGGTEGGNRLGSAVAYVRQRNIPVVALAVGDPEPPQNVAVLRLQGPTEVRKGSDVELTAYLSHRNCGDESVEIRLDRRPRGGKKWRDTGARKTVRLARSAKPGASQSQEVVLRPVADALGEFEYRVRAKPLDQEFSAADNEAVAKVRVSDQKLKVLMVSGDGGWEFLYLRNFLLTSPDRYAVSVWQQNAEKAFNQEASTGMRLRQLPRKPKELFEYEVVILYDPVFTQGGFDGEFAKLLEDFVRNHHGGLCYIASNKYTDMNLARPGDFDPLAALLPVVVERRALSIADRITRGEPSPWIVLPTAVGLDHPVLRLGDAEKENAGTWNVLPGVYWSHPVVKLKPLASALAVSSDPVRRTSDGSGEPAPIVAVQYYGKGRSLYLGTDETWRWRALEDGVYYRRFWSNAVDFLASGRLQKKRVVITAGADRFSVGDELRLRVEAYDRDYRPLDAETFTVEMIDRGSGKARKITLRPDPKKKAKGHYEAQVKLIEIGTFELTAMRGDPTRADAVAGKTITVTLPQEEFRHPEADLDTMRTLAPEGMFLQTHEADRLAELVPAGKLTVSRDVLRDLWDVPLTLALLVLLLGVEWVVRKKHNMA